MLAEASPTDPSRERGAGGDSAKRKHIVWNEDNLSYNEANKSVRARFARPDPAVRLGSPRRFVVHGRPARTTSRPPVSFPPRDLISRPLPRRSLPRSVDRPR